MFRRCLSVGICTAATMFILAGIADADETSPSPAAAPISVAPALHPQAPAKDTETTPPPLGTYYRIDANSYAYYEKPKAYSFLVNAPLNIVDWLKDSFQKKNALTIAGIAVATAGLIAVDQDLYKGARDVGHTLHISGDSVMGRVSPGSPIQYPKDTGTALYYLGDGMIPIAITVGMFSYGMYTSDVRSLQTSSQLAEGLLSVAIVTQTIKRSTGRESPGEATQSGGTWRPFPSFSKYGSSTPKYDAFPSGHLATGMMTITVLADNYPEYTLIRPIGYTLMGLLGFQMMNNGVHWASDYPLAIAIGYGLGKVASSHGRKVVATGDVPEKATKQPLVSDITMLPVPVNNGAALVVLGKF
jgi:hypothetical protein